MRLTTRERGERRVTIPNHAALRVGTLSDIPADVVAHLELSQDEVVEQLFGSRR